jgi:hypothetical protein
MLKLEPGDICATHCLGTVLVPWVAAPETNRDLKMNIMNH